MPSVEIAGTRIGPGEPVYIIGEVGINHNGSLETARALIDMAHSAGCQAVKFQKRTPELCVPARMRDVTRETPWGLMSYLDYRRRIELSRDDYAAIDAHCRERGITWFSSCWDEPSVDFMEPFAPPCYKIASASLTNEPLLRRLAGTGKPLILSTGMSTQEQIDRAVSLLHGAPLAIAHCTSAYPCAPEDLNLSMIPALARRFPECPVGYSGHETGLQTTLAAVVLGATFVERHITLDRAMWGSDQSASVEPVGLRRLVRDVRVIEAAMGDGIKRVCASEEPLIHRLRPASEG